MSRLTFDHDLETLQKLAAKCAYNFCKTTRRNDLRDDAENDAIITLLETDFDETNDGWKSYLVTRVTGALIRQYQNATGGRLKNRPVVAPLSFDVAKEQDEELVDDANERKSDAMKRALFLLSAKDKKVINALLKGEKQKKIAARLKLSRGRISQIVKNYKVKVLQCVFYGQGVVIVDFDKEPCPKELEERCPLFILQKGQ